MSESLQRAQFRSQMVLLRHSVDTCAPEDSEFYYRELMREVKKLVARFRTGNQFVVAKNDSIVVASVLSD